MRWLLQHSRWERAIVGAIAAIMTYQLFCDPIVGTADNQDFWRVMDQLGLGYMHDSGPTLFKSIQTEFAIVPAKSVQYLTSQLLLGRIALAINDVISKDGLFDLRVMGFVNAAAYLAALAVFLAAFRRRKTWIRVFVGLAALVMFTDVRIVAYFSSFYCEPAQIIFLIATLGCALLTIDESRSRRQRLVSYIAFVVTAILFFFAKTQDLTFCMPVAVIAFWILPLETHHHGYARASIAALIVASFVWGLKSDAYAVTNNINVQITLDEEILPHSKTPQKDLQALGDGDRARVTFGRIAWFYAKRPHRWWKLARRRMKQAFTHTPYGNFEAPVAAESRAFDEFSSWKDRTYPRSPWFWILSGALYVGALGAKWRLGGRTSRSMALMNAMWVVGCVLQFVAVATFEANGTEKHFFIFNVLVDLVIVFAVIELASLVTLLTSRRRDAAHAPPA